MLDFFQTQRGNPTEETRGVKIPDAAPQQKGDFSPVGSDEDAYEQLNRYWGGGAGAGSVRVHVRFFGPRVRQWARGRADKHTVQVTRAPPEKLFGELCERAGWAVQIGAAAGVRVRRFLTRASVWGENSLLGVETEVPFGKKPREGEDPAGGGGQLSRGQRGQRGGRWLTPRT